MEDDKKLSDLLGGETDTSGSGESAGERGDAGETQTENLRLRQEVARLQGMTQDSLPFVRAVQDLAKSTLGKQVIKKLQKGESVDDLLPKEVKELEKEAAKEGLTVEGLTTLLDERDQKLTQNVAEGVRVQMEAKEGVRQLDEWASKEFAGYDKIKGTPAWNGYLSAAQTAIQEGTLQLPKGKDPYQELYRRVYNMCVSEDPDIAKGTKIAAPKTPEERLAGILSSDNKPAASSSQDKINEDNIPESYKRQLEHIRKLKGGTGPTGIGLSFSNPSRNK